MYKHYKFGYRRASGKLCYFYVWAESIPAAWNIMLPIAAKRGYNCVRYING